MSLALVDACGANISSVLSALRRLGVDPIVTADAKTIAAADKVLMPGVGAASDAMQRLRHKGLDTLIPQLTQPVLGICVGMQVLFDSSEEGNVDCLGIIPGRLLQLQHDSEHPVPHMGWNVLHPTSHALFKGIDADSFAYFVHSYALPVTSTCIAKCGYGVEFSAAVAYNNFIGVQFHPERSSATGSRVLKNFLEL